MLGINAGLMGMLKDMLGVDPEQILKMGEDVKEFGAKLIERLDRIEQRLSAVETALNKGNADE